MTETQDLAATAPQGAGWRPKEAVGSTGFLRAIGVQNFLSFGPELSELALANLNLLVGPNGSGKSNLLELLSLHRSSVTDFLPVLLKGGGIREWIWKGQPSSPAESYLAVRRGAGADILIHDLALVASNQGFSLQRERVSSLLGGGFYERTPGGVSLIRLSPGGRFQVISNGEVDPGRSILAQRRDPEVYPEITYLADVYPKIRLYREWTFGRNTVFREPQRADSRNDRLEEDFSNLGLVLNRLRRNPKVKAELIERLRDLYEGLTDFDVSVEGGTVQVFFTEGDFTIPATRLSDGSLRYLCLLAILCDPEPPPLIGIEEPELGLHPDLIPKIADLLVEASKRTQLIVTTHSDILVDALSEQPESIVICEKHEGQTTMKRLERAELAEWLKSYRLGELWTRGHLGGTRW